MARAGLELALWDLKARKMNLPLFQLYGGVFQKIPAGVSVGIQDSVAELINRVEEFLKEGYQRIKLKIKPGWDIDICREIRNHFSEILLQVDANGAYSREASEKLQDLDEFNLLMVEQPFPPYDLWEHSLLQQKMRTPLCLDESIYDYYSARSAVEMGSCRVINIKVGRVGGIIEARRIHDYCQEKGIPVWCGGMLESGIGRAHNLHLASLPNFKFPHDLSASRRYYPVDIIEPEIVLEPKGEIRVPEGPGIGVTPREKMIESLTLHKEVLIP
jgi:O-succinylbenzoate synthase